MSALHLNTRKISRVILPIAGLLLIIVIILAFTTWDNTTDEVETAVSAIPVEVATPVYKKITEWDEYTGRFEASNRVEVRARVSGFLQSVEFADGQVVSKGEVLFVIDDRPFKIALDEANANYGQALASLKTAKDNYDRVESL